jgi:hypothetical protein
VFHFFDVGWRVKVVRVEKGPAETRGEQFADRGFSRSGGAHQQNDHGRLKLRSLGQERRSVSKEISGGTPRRTGAPTVPNPRFT